MCRTVGRGMPRLRSGTRRRPGPIESGPGCACRRKQMVDRRHHAPPLHRADRWLSLARVQRGLNRASFPANCTALRTRKPAGIVTSRDRTQLTRTHSSMSYRLDQLVEDLRNRRDLKTSTRIAVRNCERNPANIGVSDRRATNRVARSRPNH